MIKKIAYIIVLFFLLASSGCDTTTPTLPATNERDYQWNIDTIFTGIQTYLTEITGSSIDNLYAAGLESNGRGLFHFNGTGWTQVKELPETQFFKNYQAISMIDSTYMIAVGEARFRNYAPPPLFFDSGLVMIYNGGNWEADYLSNSFGLFALCVIAKHNFWVGDRNGKIIHINNGLHNSYNIGESLFINGIVTNTDLMFAVAFKSMTINNISYGIDYLFQFRGNSWEKIDSNYLSVNESRYSFPALLKVIDNNFYGSGDEGIVKKNGNIWEVIGPGLHGQFNGTADNNIFLAHQDFGVMHFNGRDWFRFEQLPHLRYTNVLVHKSSVVLIASDGVRTYIVRGKKQS